MKHSYIIYFGAKPYYIVNHLWPQLYAQTEMAGNIIANHPDAGTIKKTISDMYAAGTRAVIILTNEVEHYWQLFQKHFSPVTAGGGIVFNDNKEILFIYRRGKWDLPKGKLDEGETIEACALREVQEETGLNEVFLEKFAGNTWHIYAEKGKTILKTTAWYIMQAPGRQTLVPQTEEEITEMKWVPADFMNAVMENTYPSVKLIIEEAIANP